MTTVRAVCPVAFDHNSPEYTAAGLLGTFAQLGASALLSWAESDDGYWVVFSYAAVAEAREPGDLQQRGVHSP